MEFIVFVGLVILMCKCFYGVCVGIFWIKVVFVLGSGMSF